MGAGAAVAAALVVAPVLGGRAGGFATGVETSSLPVTAFYDDGGRLLERHVGALIEDSLRQAIAELYGIDSAVASS